MYKVRLTLLASVLVVVIFVLAWLSKPPAQDIYSGIVVPHHDMVKAVREAFLNEVARANNPKTIILISPDHFGTNRAPITVSTRKWELDSGTIEPDLKLIEKLNLKTDAGDFLNEHGITTVLADIKDSFPAALVVPAMMSTKANPEEIKAFVDSLNNNCGDCLLVASVDFSHSFEVNVASLHDVLTLRSLYQLNKDSLYHGAEVDSPGTLMALAYWAELKNTRHFDLFSHTNSGQLNNTSVGEMTTHIIGGYKAGELVKDLDNNLTMMFGGDVMLARGVAGEYDSMPSEALIKGLGDRVFWGVDLSVVNFEGVFANSTDYEAGWYEYPPVFRFSPDYLRAFRSAKINTVSLANNHNDDGLLGEYEYTKSLFNHVNINVVESMKASTTPLIKVVGETKVALFGYSAFEPSTDILPLITKYRDLGYRVVVYAHFGEEYKTVPGAAAEAVAKDFVDAGAGLVVGAHSHVLQPVSVYQGVPIVYSLGNLLFDQKHNGAELGAILGARFSEDGLMLFMSPVETYVEARFSKRDISGLLSAWKANQVEINGHEYFFPLK
jgi:AmmeMemoRadiSam system protein B